MYVYFFFAPSPNPKIPGCRDILPTPEMKATALFNQYIQSCTLKRHTRLCHKYNSTTVEDSLGLQVGLADQDNCKPEVLQV